MKLFFKFKKYSKYILGKGWLQLFHIFSTFVFNKLIKDQHDLSDWGVLPVTPSWLKKETQTFMADKANKPVKI